MTNEALSKLNKEKKDTDNKGGAIALSVGHGMTDAYSGFLNPIMPFIAMKLGITLAIATTIISIAQLCSSIIQPFFGYLSDMLKKRFFIFWGLVIASSLLSLTGCASTPIVLTLCLALGSMGVAFYHPQATAIVKQLSKKEPTKYMSIFLACGTAGFSAGPLISSYVVKNFGLHNMGWLMIFGWICAILMLKFVPKTSDSSSFKEFTEKAFNRDVILHFWSAVKECFSNSDFKILFSISVAKCLTVSSYCVFLPFLWQKIGYEVSTIGTLIFAFVSAGALATISSGFFESKLGAVRVYYLSMLTTFPLTLILVFTYASHPVISYIALILTGFFALLAIPINMVMAQNTVPQHRGLAAGFIGGFSWGLVGVMLPVTGFAAEHLGIPTLLLCVSILPLVTAMFVKRLKVTK